jgi:hypothetical protein
LVLHPEASTPPSDGENAESVELQQSGCISGGITDTVCRYAGLMRSPELRSLRFSPCQQTLDIEMTDFPLITVEAALPVDVGEYLSNIPRPPHKGLL